MIIDLHSHTNFSHCGYDDPEALVLEMIKRGVNVLGINDHSVALASRREEYLSTLTALKEKYKNQITLYCGIELATVPERALPSGYDLTGFEYGLIENIDSERTIAPDLFEYVKGFNMPLGIAHTDIFAFSNKKYGNDCKFIELLVEHNVYWELNVSLDSVHRFREHEYVKEFFVNTHQQDIARKSGLKISVGFDGHKMDEYKPYRVQSALEFLEKGKFNVVKGFADYFSKTK